MPWVYLFTVKRTKTYGLNSIVYQSVVQWNELQLRFPNSDISIMSIPKISKLYKSIIFNTYQFIANFVFTCLQQKRDIRSFPLQVTTSQISHRLLGVSPFDFQECIQINTLLILVLKFFNFYIMYLMYSSRAPWYSGHGFRLLHRRSRFDSRSRRFTWQVNEPSPGSTHAL